MALKGHQRAKGKTDEWLTPRWILDPLGSFDLDPCAPILRPWPTATMHYTINDDGLLQQWWGRVWLNPPFGNKEPWLERMANHGNGIALIPAATETELFYRLVWGVAKGFLFIKTRPHFCTPLGDAASLNSGAPMCLIAYSDNDLGILRRSGLGVVVVEDRETPRSS